jgi:hypothetical protein
MLNDQGGELGFLIGGQAKRKCSGVDMGCA